MEEYQELRNNDDSKIKWNKVTWYSQILAVLLGVGIFALGFWLGVQGKFEAESQLKSINLSLQESNNSLVELKLENSKRFEELIESKRMSSLTGICGKDESMLPERVFMTAVAQVEEMHPTYQLDRVHGLGKNNLINIYPRAHFNCVLGNGTYLMSIVYENNAEGEFPPVRLRVVHFDAEGNLIQISNESETDSVGGDFEVENITDGILSFSSKVIDPCYEAVHTYQFNLLSSDFNEVKMGGDSPSCWESLNSRGSFY